MQLRRHLGLIYIIIVALIFTMGLWWIVFMAREGTSLQRSQLRQLDTDLELARSLTTEFQNPAAPSDSVLIHNFPGLSFQRTADTLHVSIDPEAQSTIQGEANRHRRMLYSEGLFFLALLAGASTILVMAHRSEADFRQSRELFLTGATHEFKTPLAAVRLFTETLDRDGVSEPDRRRIRANMLEDIDHLDSLVNRILVVANPAESGFGPQRQLDIAHESREVLGELTGFLDSSGATLTADLPAGCWTMGDSTAFRLALHDLVRNAGCHGGHPARIELCLQPGSQWHRLRVRDHGPGISPELHGRIFDCFYSNRTGPGRQGAGLGLFLVRRSVEKLGGRVEVDSRPGHGATFTLLLPVTAEKTT